MCSVATPHSDAAPPARLPTRRCLHPFGGGGATSPEAAEDETLSDARHDEEQGLRVSYRQRKLEAVRSAYNEQVRGGGGLCQVPAA
jgi:hypothetical protein